MRFHLRPPRTAQIAIPLLAVFIPLGLIGCGGSAFKAKKKVVAKRRANPLPPDPVQRVEVKLKRDEELEAKRTAAREERIKKISEFEKSCLPVWAKRSKSKFTDTALLADFTDPHHGGNCAAFSPNGSYLAFGNVMRVDIWDLSAAKKLNTIQAQDARISFSPNSQYLAIAGMLANKIQVLDVLSGKFIFEAEHDNAVFGFHFQSSTILTTVGRNKQFAPVVRYWNIKKRSISKDVLFTKQVRTFAPEVVFSADGSKFACWTGAHLLDEPSPKKFLWVWRTKDAALVGAMKIEKVLSGNLVFSPDGWNLINSHYTGPDLSVLCKWEIDTKDNQVLFEEEGVGGDLVCSPDGRYVAGGMFFRIFNVCKSKVVFDSHRIREVQPLAEIPGQPLAISPGGTFLVDQFGKLWRFDMLLERGTKGHN